MDVSTGRVSETTFQEASNRAAIPNSVVAPTPKLTASEFDGVVGLVRSPQPLLDSSPAVVVQGHGLSAGEMMGVGKPFGNNIRIRLSESAGAATEHMDRSPVGELLRPRSRRPIKAPTQNYAPIAIAAKRAMDVALGLLLILCLAAVFAVLAVLIKLTSPGPVFYAQERVGQHGKIFRMYKFRSMKVNADAELAALLHAQGTANSPFFKVDKDPRLTSIGGFLRRYSLDELPQLINVLVGNMSLVGPRPQRPGEVALYDEHARRRLLVPPGMTGLWQVSGRSNLSWKESLHLDIHYVDNWSLVADWVILCRTFRAVFACTGAV